LVYLLFFIALYSQYQRRIDQLQQSNIIQREMIDDQVNKNIAMKNKIEEITQCTGIFIFIIVYLLIIL
jgi:hypothetical protein